MTLSGTLTAAGYMWCMVEKTGTAPAKKTGWGLERIKCKRVRGCNNGEMLVFNAPDRRRLSNATNKTNATNATKNTTTPVTPTPTKNVTVDAYADLRK
jgi:hypothetical protein